MLRNGGVQTLVLTHALSNCCFYGLLTWIPMWYSSGLGLSMEQAGTLAFVPYAGNALLSPLAGRAADYLVRRGVPTVTVRRGFQGCAFFGGAACLATLATAGPGLGVAAQFALASGPMFFHALSRAGMFCTHADLSPRYAGALMSASTTAGALAPTAFVVAVGALVGHTKSFGLGLFAPICAVQLLAGLLYCTRSKHERQAFDAY